jgi:hypothetical protein
MVFKLIGSYELQLKTLGTRIGRIIYAMPPPFSAIKHLGGRCNFMLHANLNIEE